MKIYKNTSKIKFAIYFDIYNFAIQVGNYFIVFWNRNNGISINF